MIISLKLIDIKGSDVFFKQLRNLNSLDKLIFNGGVWTLRLSVLHPGDRTSLVVEQSVQCLSGLQC